MIGDTRWSVRISEIRWDELPEARQPARPGKSLSQAAQTRLQWVLFYLFNGRNVAHTCEPLADSLFDWPPTVKALLK